MTAHEHACFQMGLVGGVALTLAITAVFGWLFITITERDWTRTPGRLIPGWRNRR